MTRLRGDERGMTLVEVLVGMVIAVAAVLAVSSLVTTGTANSLGDQRDTQLFGAAQREAEAVRQTAQQDGFDAVALTAPPPAATVPLSANPLDPAAQVTGTRLRIQPDYASSVAGAPAEALIVGGTPGFPAPGRVAPYTADVSIPGVDGYRARVWRFVTDDPTYTASCGTPSAPHSCSGDARRVTIAVRPVLPGADAAGDGGARDLERVAPVWISFELTAPVPKFSSATGSGLLSLAVGTDLP